METSTGLSYLIVLGGSGSRDETKRKLFALPIINDYLQEFSGMLANKNSIPVSQFGDKKPYRFDKRYFYEPALKPGDLYEETDQAARIGGTVTLEDDIRDLFVAGDAIYILVDNKIYYSHALFDEHGRIKGWTNWAVRGSYAGARVRGAAFNARTSQLLYLTRHEDAPDNLIDTVYQTEWQYDMPLFEQVHKFFPQEKGGITSVIQDDTLSAYILTGDNQVAFIDQARNNAPFVYEDSGIQSLGNISATVMIENEHERLLVIAGKNGCATLTDGNGNGIPAGVTFQDLSQRQEEFSFKKVLDCKDVKKLLINNNNLFILSKNSLSRVDTLQNNWHAEVMAAPATFNDKYILYNDCFISGKLCLLGTSAGLFRNNNYTDVATVGPHPGDWISIPLAENVGAVTQFLTISPTHKENESATHSCGGNLYVLNAHRGKDQARIYRFTFNPTREITDQTVIQLPDYFVHGKKSFFMNLGSYKTGLYTNGGSFFLYSNACVANKNEPNPFCELLFPGWTSGKSFLTQSSTKVLHFPKARRIGNMLRNTSNGQTIIYGDFGLCVYE